MGRSNKYPRREEEEIPPASEGPGRPAPSRKGVTVFVVEEYGYRHWQWNSGLSEQQLREFWAALPSVNSGYFHPKSLLRSGRLLQVRERPAYATWRMHMHQDDDSYLRTPQGEVITHAGYVGE
jgi:hypothetical protein